ncbi:MAG: hypothetical protein AUK47_01720 [Deltaproteobacteria bacterium CG2_30_63_29]|nr:MAG: hypothetical protein AUK47_01720 [Deltaproteobacteria bacterium CG2_30_63_29]
MINIPKDQRPRLIASLRRYIGEELELELSELQGELMLSFVLAELGPTIYNRAVSDARAFMSERVADMEGSCYEPEFAHYAPQRRK